LRSQLASEATVPQLEQKFTQSARLLAALTGHVPVQWSAPVVVEHCAGRGRRKNIELTQKPEQNQETLCAESEKY
jgi:hypothetical protein